MSSVIFSIIMPTYNSEKTIRFSLNSINEQIYDKSKIECLVIDGGSTDQTLNIAREYSFVKILKNKKRLPEFAKKIGFENAAGKYVIKMDSDEAFSNNGILAARERAFAAFPDAHILVANELRYKKSVNNGIAGNYLNGCGDPFTYFIYKQKRTFLETYRSNIANSYDNGFNVLCFGRADKRPIADGGTTTVDLEFVKSKFADEISNINFICSVSDKVFDITHKCICIENDVVFHRSDLKLTGYLKKINFRIANNIFAKEESGFSSRSASKGHKKYLFPLYTISFVFPLIDSIRLSVEYKDIFMLFHIFYCYYTCFYIAWCMLLKLFKVKKINKEY